MKRALCCLLLLALALPLYAAAGNHGEDYVPFVPTSKHRTGEVVDMTGAEFVKLMGVGWNLGNTLEATGDPKFTRISQFETSWGNPLTTKEMIDKIASLGFKSMRLPVGWSNLMAEDFTIRAELMDRVEEIAGFALDNDMYVVINIHWDGGWYSKFAREYDWAMAKFTAIWNQVSERFRDYDDHIIFECNNEIEFGDYFNCYGGLAAVTEKAKPAYDLLLDVNQRFVDTVRATGGNNARRYLLCVGYNTDIDLTCHEYFRMPDDPAGHLLISLHYYTPWDFVGLKEDASYAPMRTTWGTLSDMRDLRFYMNKITKFRDAGYGVVLGEYSVCDGVELKNPASVRLWNTTVTKTAYDLGYCPMYWDNGWLLLNRNTLTFYDEEQALQLSQIANSPR